MAAKSAVYSIFQLVLAFALIGWGIAYGYANYQGDDCTETFNALSASNQARVNSVQIRIHQDGARVEELQARARQVTKGFNGTEQGGNDRKN
jgi:hypothetical protein